MTSLDIVSLSFGKFLNDLYIEKKLNERKQNSLYYLSSHTIGEKKGEKYFTILDTSTPTNSILKKPCLVNSRNVIN